MTSAPSAWQLGGGWFITPSLLAKAEYVEPEVLRLSDDQHQERRQVQGLMLEGVVAF